MSQAPPDLSLLNALTPLVRDIARTEILPRFGQTTAEAKADGSLITAVDLAMQRQLIDALAQLTPDIPVLGEEMTPEQQHHLLGEHFWAVDPLDGTSNFVCGFPAFAVSLALFRAGQAVLGLIYDPCRDECFQAALGQGAWLNDHRLSRPAAPQQLAEAMALMDFKRLAPTRVPALLRAGAFRSQRNLGSVALDWCWLAAGRAQVYLHGGQRLWDYAAGHLIATEAGIISQLLHPDNAQAGKRADLKPRLALAAASPALFDQWHAFLALPWQD